MTELPLRQPPVEESRGLLYFTDGTLAYAGHYIHEERHPEHTHSFVEIAVVVGGQGQHRSLSGCQELRIGDVVVLRPGVWHGYERCRGLDLYNCCFSTELLRRELAWMQEDPLLGYLLWSGPFAMQRRGLLTSRLESDALRDCVEHLEALDRLRSLPIGLHRGDIIGRLALLLSALARAVDQGREGTSTPAGPTHPAVITAMRMMEAAPAYKWTLTELAQRLHLAPGYLIRLFKSATGLPPMAYLSRFRVETAAEMLLHTDQPVTQIGTSVGWPDQNYFARRFKAHYGLAASTYRARFSHTAVHLQSWPATHH
ncbi:MAG TPA: AraC family transcriptional regulator [Pseudonocardiaceae bacterium]|nr:AraC family transcriptional regulator [Pseudonocardiaceae bacterium]